MSAALTLLLGPAGSGKTTVAIEQYARQLSTGPPGCGLWLAPSSAAADAVRQRLAAQGRGAWLRPNVMTFADLARHVLAAEGSREIPISRLVQRHLLSGLIEQAAAAGELSYFGAIADKPGFTDLIVELVRELKRLEIWPEELDEAQGSRGRARRDAELGLLYRRYQELLKQHQLFDVEGQLWSARAHLRQSCHRAFGGLALVVADGFSDFTRTQYEILALLLAHAGSMWVTLPLEESLARRELFAKPLATRRLLESLPAQVKARFFSRRTVGSAALNAIESRLFTDAVDEPDAVEPAGVEIIAGPRVQGELELVARRIKRLLVEGEPTTRAPARPDQVVVSARGLSQIHSLLIETLDRHGIPWTSEVPISLGQVPLLRALAAVLRMHFDDWPFAQLLAVLGHCYLRPAWNQWHNGRAAAAADLVVRRMQIASGRRTLLESVARREAQFHSDSVAASRHRELAAQIALAGPLLRRMAQSFERLPTRASPGAWFAALAELANDLGMLASLQNDAPGATGAKAGVQHSGPGDAADRSPSNALDELDRAGWEELGNAFSEIEHLACATSEPSPEWDVARLRRAFDDFLAHCQVPPRSERFGCVRLVSATTLRALRVDYLFVVGLGEGAFPQPEAEDRLYAERELRAMFSGNLSQNLSGGRAGERSVVLQTERAPEEMLLFYELVTRANRRLTLSYAALDDKAQPMLPSPFLRELEKACGKPKGLRFEVLDLSPVPSEDDVTSIESWRVLAVDQAARNKSEPRLLTAWNQATSARETAASAQRGPIGAPVALASPAFGSGENLLHALTVGQARSRSAAFGPYEGMLEPSPPWLRLQFGPTHVWSVSELEHYGTCPFRFFLDHVLKLEPLAELQTRIDYKRRGWVLHEVLARAHRQLNDRAGTARSPAEIPLDEFLADVSLLLEPLLPTGHEGPLESALATIDEMRIRRWLTRYYEQHARYDERPQIADSPFRPAHFEVVFGMDDIGTDPLSTAEALRIEHGGQTLRMQGRIDRIDLAECGSQSVFTIIDYKTGASPSQKSLREQLTQGKLLQLAVYAMAVERLLLAGDGPRLAARASSVGLWHVADRGFQSLAKLVNGDSARIEPSSEWHELQQVVIARVAALVEGIRNAEFPVHNEDEHCTGRCDFSTVCRVTTPRALDKTWQPPEPKPT